MAQQVINIGTNPNDGTGEPLRGAVSKVNAMFTEVYALQSQTINAGAVEYNFTGATTEQRIQLAINAALAGGFDRVYVPAFMLPYDATLITFNSAVQMVREGGDASSWDVQAYGAAGNYTQDDTASIRATITGAAAAGTFGYIGGRVYFPKGVYRVTSPITISQSYMQLWGDAAHGVVIRFQPTANGACFDFDGNGTSLWNCGIKRMRFVSTDTTYTKTMIRVEDVRHFHLEEIISADGEWTGNGSIGLQTLGREYIVADRCQFYADRPVVHSINPTLASISLDMCSFNDMQYVVSSGLSNYNVEIEDGVVWTNTRWANCDSARGIGAVKYNNTITALSSFMNIFDNWRQEQGIAGATYTFDLQSTNGQIGGTSFRNVTMDPVLNGIKLRKAFRTVVDTFSHAQAGGDAINVDATCGNLILRNFFYQTGATLTGLTTFDSVVYEGLVSGLTSTHQGLWTRTAIASGLNAPSEAVLVSGVDARQGNQVWITLTAARAVGTPLNPIRGQRLQFQFIQGGAGGFAVTWGAVFKQAWVDTGNTVGKRSSIAYIYDGSNWNQDGAQSPYL